MTRERFVSLAAALAITALVNTTPAWSQIVPASPVATPPRDDSPVVLPGATGLLFEAPINLTDSNSVHEGRFTWGPDLVAPPLVGDPTQVLPGWVSGLIPSAPELLYTATVAYPFRLKNALDAATDKLEELDAGGIGSVLTTFVDVANLIPGASFQLTSSPTHAKQTFLGYAPLRSRWLHSQWASLGPSQPEKKYVYNDYTPFRDIRLRGARFYCAARTAAIQQGGQRLSLGQRAGFSVSVLGQQIDFLVIEPSVALNGPQKFFFPDDGAQAFTVPLLLGTAIEPIRGVGLPPVGEAQVPAVFVGGESEVRTRAAKRPIFTGWQRGVPIVINDYSKEYYTVTHSDAFLTAGFYGDQKYRVDGKLLLFFLGPLKVYGLLGVDYAVGKPGVDTVTVKDDRVLVDFPFAGWPPLGRTGHRYQNPIGASGQYHDGAWAFKGYRRDDYFVWEVQPDGVNDDFWRIPIAAPFIRPHDLRALSDDDHIVSSTTSLGLTLGLQGDLGGGFDPFDIHAEVQGTFSGTVDQHTMLRDALMVQVPPTVDPPLRPFTSLTVRPRQTASIQFDGLKATLRFHLDLGWFGDITFTKTLFETDPQIIAQYDSDAATPSPSDEQYILRIANGATSGNAMTQPNVMSHLPGGADFKTFPQDVAACLADPADVPPPPPPCEPGTPTGAPPSAELCIYGPSKVIQEEKMGTFLPASGVCSNINGWVSTLTLSGDQKACISSYLGFLCAPVSQEQTFQGTPVVARVWNFEPSMNAALKPILEQCGTAFVGTEIPPTDPVIHDAVIKLTDGLIGIAACDKNATLMTDSQIIQSINPTTPPPPAPGQICKQ